MNFTLKYISEPPILSKAKLISLPRKLPSRLPVGQSKKLVKLNIVIITPTSITVYQVVEWITLYLQSFHIYSSKNSITLANTATNVTFVTRRSFVWQNMSSLQNMKYKSSYNETVRIWHFSWNNILEISKILK